LSPIAVMSVLFPFIRRCRDWKSTLLASDQRIEISRPENDRPAEICSSTTCSRVRRRACAVAPCSNIETNTWRETDIHART
jgi:hypothetical protein